MKFSKAVKYVLLFLIIYYLTGIPLGYLGLELGCHSYDYYCRSFGEYLTDPWLWINNIFWPMSLLDGILK